MNMSFVPEPVGLKFPEWGALVAEQLAPFGVCAPLDDSTWTTWVSALHQVPELASMNIPRAEGFESWIPWAQQFIGSVR